MNSGVDSYSTRRDPFMHVQPSSPADAISENSVSSVFLADNHPHPRRSEPARQP